MSLLASSLRYLLGQGLSGVLISMLRYLLGPRTFGCHCSFVALPFWGQRLSGVLVETPVHAHPPLGWGKVFRVSLLAVCVTFWAKDFRVYFRVSLLACCCVTFLGQGLLGVLVCLLRGSLGVVRQKLVITQA